MNKQKTFIHSENSIFSLNIRYLLVLLPLILFGFYKNGILVYQKGYTTILGMFKPLIIPLMGFGIGLLLFFLLVKRKKNNLIMPLKASTFPIQTLIVGMTMPIKVNIYAYLVLMIVLSIIYLKFFYNKKFSFNFIALSIILIILGSYLLGDYKNILELYINNYEASVSLNPSLYRLIIGFNHSGLGISSHLIVIIVFIYLMGVITYKREIPIFLIVSFIIVGIISLIMGSTFSSQLRYLFNSSIIFSLFFIANESTSSPTTNLAMIFYSLLIVILYLVFNLFASSLAIYLAIFVVSIFSYSLDIIFKKTKFSSK